MRIGLNLLYLLPGIVGGTETYAAGLLHGFSQLESDDEFYVFVNLESSEWKLPGAWNFRRVICPIRASCRPWRYSYEQLLLPKLAEKYHLDVLHSAGYVAPLPYRHASVVSILDIVYDNPGSPMRRAVLQFLISRSARRASHILTLSLSSKRQIVSRLGIPQEKVTVTYLAPKNQAQHKQGDWSVLGERLGIRGSYIMALGSLSPHKNISALVRAYHNVIQGRSEQLQLVIAGHLPARGTSIRDLVQSLQLEEHTVFTGYLPDADLDLLYSQATAFIFPSLYEGFGLPILEAMTHGTPVACSNVASLPEVAGDAAVLFNPRSPDEIKGAIQALLDDPELRASLIRKGHLNASRFSWRKTAEETMSVYQDVVSGPPPHRLK